MQSRVRSVRAVEPRMDYWFSETLTVGQVVLPVGVVIHSSNPGELPRGVLVLENQTETLLYVLSLSYKDVLVMATPDPNWKSRVDSAHEVASYLVAPDRPAYLNMEALTDLDRNLVDQNVLSYDSPPANVSIPVTQSSELLLVYGGQVIEVPFTLAYALNTKFDNGSGPSLNQMPNVQATDNAIITVTQQAEASATRMARNTTLIVGLAGVAVLIIAGWLVWRRLIHRN